MPKINFKEARRFKTSIGEAYRLKMDGGEWIRPPLASYYLSNIPLHLDSRFNQLNINGLLTGIKNAGGAGNIHNVIMNNNPFHVVPHGYMFENINSALVFNTHVQIYGSTLMFAINMTGMGNTQSIFSSPSNNPGYAIRIGSIQTNDSVFMGLLHSPAAGAGTSNIQASPRFVIPRRWAIFEIDLFSGLLVIKINGIQVSQVSFPLTEFYINQIGSGWGGSYPTCTMGEVIKIIPGNDYAAALLAARQHLASLYGITL